MSTGPHIRYLKRQDIDPVRWDNCVKWSPNGWLYLHTFFLDAWGPWDALVAHTPQHGEDYACIMPLPKKRKYGLTYTYILPLPGQLGIAGILPLTAHLTNEFLRRIPPSFRLVDTLLNEGNTPPSLPGVEVIPRTNYVLPLNTDYPALYARFNDDAKKNLRQAYAKGLYPDTDIPVEQVIHLYHAAYGNRISHLSAKSYRQIAQLCRECME
ncbi:MAG TPA: hypothetical protein VKQ52_05815, partial [Puia sp.]|nr:hypothetical protein [Puia sp.]